MLLVGNYFHENQLYL